MNDQKQTPLHKAAQTNSKEIGELLISKGAAIDEKDIIYQIKKKLFIIRRISNR